MVGDVNVFLDKDNPTCAELCIMVAEPSWRRHGVASAALSLSMEHAHICHGVTRFSAKIKEDNVSSMALFEKLGFHYVRYEPILEEHWYELAYPSSVTDSCD